MSKTKPLPPPATEYHAARRIYFESLLRLGFTLMRLYKIRANGECACSRMSSTRLTTKAKMEDYFQNGTIYPCGNKGKHPVGTALRSVLTSIKKIEDHLDNGGSVGICLRIEGLPEPPIRLVILDRDRPGSEQWLRSRGIQSPLEVIGKRGGHDYMLLPDGVPDLNSDTRNLNPGKDHPTTEDKPGIDIKVSGLVVAAYSVNKTLFWNGIDISADPMTVGRIFESLDSLRSLLPVFDPRVISPRMTLFKRDVQVSETDGTGKLEPATPSQPGSSTGLVTPIATLKSKLSRASLSHERQPQESLTGRFQGVRYSHRMDLAKKFLRGTQASIEGDGYRKNTFRVVASLLDYHLSEVDVLNSLVRHFSPRCLDANGKHNPPEEISLVRMIIKCRDGNVRSPIGLKTPEGFKPKSNEEILAGIRACDKRAQEKRRIKQLNKSYLMDAHISAFLDGIGASPERQDLFVPSNKLLDVCNAFLKAEGFDTLVIGKHLGQFLSARGYKKDQIRLEGKTTLVVRGICLDHPILESYRDLTIHDCA